MKKDYIKLIVFLSILILGFFIISMYLSWPLLFGKSIILKTQPIDPFDLIRGQYQLISYDIGRIENVNNMFSTNNLGKNIYVTLKKDPNGTYIYNGAGLTRPREGDFIKGKIKKFEGDHIQVDYGIEQYFFERGASFPRFNEVEVKVDSLGNARIYQFLLDGKIMTINYKKKSI
jgi:uncharacterized membrane-anchored protein